jgi:hypothetical protein
MRYKAIAFSVLTLALTSAHFAQAQQPKKVPRIGYLSPTEPVDELTVLTQFGWRSASLAT